MAQPNLAEATSSARASAAAQAPRAEQAVWRRLGWRSRGAGGSSSSPHKEARAQIERLALRLPLCLLLGAPSLWLASAPHSRTILRPPYLETVLLGTSLLLLVWGGQPIHQRAWQALLQRRTDDAQPASLALVCAFLIGALPALHGAPLRAADLALLPVVSLFALVLALLERLIRRAARSALHGVARLSPHQACKLTAQGGEQLVPLDSLQPGDDIRVGPRELIALDGVVLEGRSSVKEQRVTGAPLPVDKRKGSRVVGGTRNGRGTLTVQVTRARCNGVLAHVARFARQAERGASALEQEATRAGNLLVVATLTLVAIALLRALLGAAAWHDELTRCLALLVVTVPGALPLCAFLSVRIGLARAIRAGVLVSSSDTLLTLAHVDTVLVGKSSTLTEGRPRVLAVVPAEGCDVQRLLGMAAGLTRDSAQPFAQAVRTRSESLGAPAEPVVDVTELPGCGYLGRVGAMRVGLGNRRLLALLDAHDVTLEGKAEALCDHGQTVVFVVWDGRVQGLIGCVDPIKLTSRDALRELEDDGVRTLLCTADARRTALHLTTQLGMAEPLAELPPAEKVHAVRRLADGGRRVAFASRSPLEETAMERAALAIGLCLETQLDRPRAERDDAPPATPRVELVQGDLATIARAVALAKALVRSQRRCLWLVFAYHGLALPLAAGIFGASWHISVAAGTPMAQLAALSGLLLLVGHALLLRRSRM